MNYCLKFYQIQSKQKYTSIEKVLFFKNIFQYFKLSENIVYEEIKDIDLQNNKIIVKNKKLFRNCIMFGIDLLKLKNITDQLISFSGLYALRGTYDLTNDYFKQYSDIQKMNTWLIIKSIIN